MLNGNRISTQWKLLLALGALAAAALACGEEQAEQPTAGTAACDYDLPSVSLQADTRPFSMGFNRWPPAATAAGLQRMNRFLTRHADLTLIHLDSGVPWPEALAGEPFSDHVRDDWAGHRSAVPAEHQLLVAITPLNMDRNGLAAYRGSSDNQPLPAAWQDRPLDHPDVIDAYTKYSRETIEFFQPDYLIIGIEANLTLNHSRELWQQYRTLHQHVYQQLKADHPDLPVFASFTYPDMKGDRDDAAAPEHHQQAVAELLPHNDLLGLSVYPYSYIYGGDGSLPPGYFDLAASYDLPIAVAESGMPSRPFTFGGTTFPFKVEHQTNYMRSLLQHAHEQEFEFVVNWAPLDFEALLQEFPPELRELGSVWAYTGLENSDGCEKPALQVWDAWLQLAASS